MSHNSCITPNYKTHIRVIIKQSAFLSKTSVDAQMALHTADVCSSAPSEGDYCLLRAVGQTPARQEWQLWACGASVGKSVRNPLLGPKRGADVKLCSLTRSSVIKKKSPLRIAGKQTTKCHGWNEERQVGSELPVIPAHAGTRRAQCPPAQTGHLSAASSEPLVEKYQTNAERGNALCCSSSL